MTANTTVLIATQGFANLGIVTPNFIVPSGFLFVNGGTVNYASVDSVTYGALPTDGTHALDRFGTVVTATPVNFSGATGVIGTNHAPTGDVTIAGTPTQEQLLTAHTETLADQDGLGAPSFQWLRGAASIAGATSSSYSLTQADVGSAISVRVSYTDGGGTPEHVTSAATSAVANVNDPPSGTVVITGTPIQGQTLSANPSGIADPDGLGTFAYQWLRAGNPIGGATAAGYTLSQADVGSSVSVRVSYLDGGGFAESVTATGTGAVANVNDLPTGGVTISGAATQGQTLTSNTASLADLDGLGTLSYQWLRGGNASAGATANTYSPTQADVGLAISVRVSYTDGGGAFESVTSSETAAVANVNDLPTGILNILGTPIQGQNLSADATALADADGLGPLSYQWLRDGSGITGANGIGYSPIQADVGHAISVRISYTDGGGTAESVTSAATGAVANVNDAPTGSVAVSGTASRTEMLVSNTSSLADADGLGPLSYQWLRGGGGISGANDSTYVLTLDDVGATISLRVSYTDGGGTLESVVSASTAVVTLSNHAPSGAIAILGVVAQGATLSADVSTLADADGLGPFAFQWLRNGLDITGATTGNYTLTQADVGSAVSVRVNYTDGAHTAEVLTSTATAAVANVNDAPTGGVGISGTALQGQSLTAVTGTLADADGLGVFSYQWLRSGNPIAGAASSSYALTLADVGQGISVQVSYTDGGETSESLVSGATAAVVPLDNIPPTVTISDNAPGTATGPVTYTLSFSEPVSGLASNDFSVTNGSVTSVTGTDSSYNVVVTPTTGVEGTLSLALRAGAVTDLSGNPNAVASAVGQPVDTRSPTVTGLTPADESLGVAVASNIVINFSEPITLGSGSIVLETGGGTAVATYGSASPSLTISGSQLTINPSADLSYGTVYQVQFAPDSVQDAAGNAYAGTTNYNFLTTVLNPADPKTAYYETVQKMYIGYFGRPADPDGLAYWENSLNVGHSPTLTDPFFVSYSTNPAARFMIDFYGTSPESSRLYAGASVEDRVTAIYQNVLDRGPDAGGLVYWSAQIRSGALTFPLLGIRIVSVAETDPSGLDSSTIAQKLAVATEFTQALDTPAEVTAYSGDAATAVARTMLNQVNGSTSIASFAPTVQTTIDQLLTMHAAAVDVPDIALIGVGDFGLA